VPADEGLDGVGLADAGEEFGVRGDGRLEGSNEAGERVGGHGLILR
jgi:hypothetical protein